MEYKATFRSMAGLTCLLLFMALLCIGVGIQAQAVGMIIVGLLFILLLIVIRLRFNVVVNDDEISATGFFRTRRVRMSDIKSAKWISEYGYPTSRFYGPFVYEIQDAEETLRVNFKLFPIECMDTVVKMIEERTSASTVRDARGGRASGEA